MKDPYQTVRAHIHGCHSWRYSFIFSQLSACLCCVYSVGEGEREKKVSEEEGVRERRG